ncbi:hypothetical protein [Streptomyces bluensis]|uniref:Uncharacterized protein n=1 Tax=Streptomyces bluensis TaxID=33897 RepID=A0ABW6UFA5_9ACTN
MEATLTGALEQGGDSFADRLAALARTYVSFAMWERLTSPVDRPADCPNSAS